MILCKGSITVYLDSCIPKPTLRFSCSMRVFRSRAQCDNTTNPDLGPICGRPLGLAFNYARNLLYIADAYVGLRVKSSSDTQGAEVATSAEGLPFRFLNGLDVDQQTGIVYFTDYSSVYQLRFCYDVSTNLLCNFDFIIFF